MHHREADTLSPIQDNITPPPIQIHKTRRSTYTHHLTSRAQKRKQRMQQLHNMFHHSNSPSQHQKPHTVSLKATTQSPLQQAHHPTLHHQWHQVSTSYPKRNKVPHSGLRSPFLKVSPTPRPLTTHHHQLLLQNHHCKNIKKLNHQRPHHHISSTPSAHRCNPHTAPPRPQHQNRSPHSSGRQMALSKPNKAPKVCLNFLKGVSTIPKVLLTRKPSSLWTHPKWHPMTHHHRQHQHTHHPTTVLLQLTTHKQICNRFQPSSSLLTCRHHEDGQPWSKGSPHNKDWWMHHPHHHTHSMSLQLA